MSPASNNDYLDRLVGQLRQLPRETGWVEFKENNASPEDIGEYLSALANTAALANQSRAYLVWGVRDGTHDVVGTSFQPFAFKKGNEDLVSWLTHSVSPRLDFRFHELTHEGHAVVVLEVPRADSRPVQFRGEEFIRVGSYRKKLKDHPQLERELWRTFEHTPFEDLVAAPGIDSSDVLSFLDYPAYFQMLDQPLPTDREHLLERLGADRLIARDAAGRWNILNLGALLFARNLEQFRSLARKCVRIVSYSGPNRTSPSREHVVHKGYAAGFTDVLNHLRALLPRSEVIENGIRHEVASYPEPALRELIPNALVHQDLSTTGSGPMIEIFTNRLEITNPGSPLIATDRFLDSPPRSRNEALASFMRRLGLCEERGSGVDKVVAETERHQLPAPLFEQPDGFTRAVLFSPRPLRDMDRKDRTRACYLHACLRYVEHEPMTNASLRARLGISEPNKAIASRIIADAVRAGVVKPADPDQGRKYARYLPSWA